jgi:hypothetical protein
MKKIAFLVTYFAASFLCYGQDTIAINRADTTWMTESMYVDSTFSSLDTNFIITK